MQTEISAGRGIINNSRLLYRYFIWTIRTKEYILMEKTKNTVEVIDPCLEIDEQLELQQKGWAFQKFGWFFILSVMIAGVLGLFGDGVLSGRTLTEGTSSISFQRFFRYETEMKILIQSQSHIASISFPEQYLKKFRIVRFVPEPINNNTIHNSVRYNFLPAENHLVTVYVIAKDFGTVDGVMRINEKENFTLKQFIYP